MNFKQRFLLLPDTFSISTNVLLRVILDPNATIVPGTQQRDLPPREIPRSLPNCWSTTT